MTMSPLKEACLIAKGLDAANLDMLKTFVDLLAELAPGSDQNPMSALERRGQAAFEYRKAKANLQGARVAHKHELLTYHPDGTGPEAAATEDPVAAKRARDAARKRAACIPKPRVKKAAPKARNGRRHTRYKPGAAIAKVWVALQQSSGEINVKELAEILGLKQVQVSSCLTQLAQRHKSVLQRRWVKGSWDSKADTILPGYYMYQYTGKGLLSGEVVP